MEMTTPPKAEEIASKITDTHVFRLKDNRDVFEVEITDRNNLAKAIAEALTSYANAVSEQRVKEATDYLTKRLIKQIEKTRNEALEEAIGKLICCSRGCFNANEDAIRSLKRGKGE